jgi:SAM-dependent methyltransferase
MVETNAGITLDGHCPICARVRRFESKHAWYRDWLFCDGCRSIPRERALALVLEELRPEWRGLAIHESSPAARGISLKMKKECRDYIETQFFPDNETGVIVQGVRNENLERLTFQDSMFDVFSSLDVMEHVNYPEKVFREVVRTLKPGGLCIFTTPTYKGLIQTARKALYHPDGSQDHLGNKPEYHGNPVSSQGSLVTFHFGYDLPELIFEWSGMNTRVYRFHDRFHGVIGDFTEVYVCMKPA